MSEWSNGVLERQQETRIDYLVRVGVVPVCLFIVALLPRLLELGVFLTSDEYRWLGRTRDFLLGILSRDWAATLQTGHPGVTTMWAGVAGYLPPQ